MKVCKKRSKGIKETKENGRKERWMMKNEKEKGDDDE